jgi:hypothetical protein
MMLLKLQFRSALQRTTSISGDTLSRLEYGIEKQMISKITVYAFDRSNLCRAQLVLEVDWDEYTQQLSQGRALVSIDERKWANNTAMEVNEAANLFSEFVDAYTLRTKWQASHPTWVTSNNTTFASVLRDLGLVLAEPVEWADGTVVGHPLRIPELPEFRVGLYMVDEE